MNKIDVSFICIITLTLALGIALAASEARAGEKADENTLTSIQIPESKQLYTVRCFMASGYTQLWTHAEVGSGNNWTTTIYIINNGEAFVPVANCLVTKE